MQTPPRTGKTIQSVQRAIDILNCFDAQTPALSLGEISARLQLNKATVHGLLNTLHNNGYVCQNSRGEYLLGSALFSKASLAGSTAGSKLRDAIAQPLQALCDRFQTLRRCLPCAVRAPRTPVYCHATSQRLYPAALCTERATLCNGQRQAAVGAC